MNHNSTQTETLIRYMDGSLSPQETAAVEASIQQNKAMADELGQLQNARLAVRRLGLQQQIAAVHTEMMPQLQQQKSALVFSITKIMMRVAAAVLFLVIGTAAYQYMTVSPGSLFSEQFKGYKVAITRDGAASNKVEEAYRAADYAGVLKQFQSIAQPEVKDQFYAGMASMELQYYPGAIQFFKDVLEKNLSAAISVFEDDAEYYLALGYLKANELDKALPLFQKIQSNPAHLYHDKVTTLFIIQLKMAGWKQ